VCEAADGEQMARSGRARLTETLKIHLLGTVTARAPVPRRSFPTW
jgi:hypothetical protein